MADKKHKVVIVFSGVVALGPPLPSTLPSDPNQPITEKGPLFGVMPHFSTRRAVTFRNSADEDVDGHTRSHVPVVFTDLKSETRRKLDDQHHRFNIWNVMRERMQITIDGDDKPGVLTYVHNRNFGQQGELGDPTRALTRAVIEDFAAVPDMRVVSPTRSTLRTGVLDPKAKDVAAQVFVPSGELRAGSEDGRKFGSVVTYGPAVRGGQPRTAVVVPQVRVTVGVDERLTIETSSLDTGAKLDPLSFVVDRDGEIWIGNLDMGDVRRIIQRLDLLRGSFPSVRAAFARLTGRMEPEVEGAAADPCDVDFVGFYDLTTGNGNVVLPCETDGRGERKCYVVTVNPGDDA